MKFSTGKKIPFKMKEESNQFSQKKNLCENWNQQESHKP
jgi:hypothetical protein